LTTAGLVNPAVAEWVRERHSEQVRGARERREPVNAYFRRESGVPDAKGGRVH
jgi:alpha-glucuronidase